MRRSYWGLLLALLLLVAACYLLWPIAQGWQIVAAVVAALTLGPLGGALDIWIERRRSRLYQAQAGGGR